MKECIIIIFIIIIVLISNFILEKYLERSTGELIGRLENLRIDIQNKEEQKRLEENYEEIYKLWEKTNDRWAIIELHEELDLIESSIRKLKANIQTKEETMAMEKIEECIFLINHIAEKEKFSLKNIF